jgi:hypothetical protein
VVEFVRDLAASYLDKLFGTHEGIAAFASKGKDNSWVELSFPWPAGRTDALSWVKRTTPTGNVFVTPALRGSANERVKGDGRHLFWLWADVDWDKVPASRREVVAQRIEELGTYVVLSGSGSNVHVYVKVTKALTPAEFHRLNTGLRDHLYADNKQADSSLLRVAGTVNWKTPTGSPVAEGEGHGRSITARELLKIKAFKNVDAKLSVDQGSIDWVPTPVAAKRIPRRMQLALKMKGDEASGRYGSRYKAVWAITGDLHKLGFTGDEIHTLLNEFIPAIEKREDENFSYDVHKDIERRLVKERLNEDEALDVDEDDDGPAFEELSDAEGNAYAQDEMVQKILARREALREADRIEAERFHTTPPPETSWSLRGALNNPPQPTPYLIHGLAGAKHNVVITAQYKTGKTAFTVGSLVQAIADGTPFLNEFQVNVPKEGAVVGHWNCEMDDYELMDDYIRPVGFSNIDNLRVWGLRGHRVNILTPLGKQDAIDWLRGDIADRDGNTPPPVKVWTIDSLARLARMAGVKEKENDEMLSLLMAVDEIKFEANVDVCFIIAHTGRIKHEEGEERARGATVIDDWPDARWIMTKDGEIRFLAVEGRGVAMPTTSLEFDAVTKRSVLGVGNKGEVRANGYVQAVLDIVSADPGINKTALQGKLKERGVSSNRIADEYIVEAEECNWIVVKRGTAVGKGGKSTLHYPTGWEKPTGGATPRSADVRKAFKARRGGDG